MDVNSLLAVLSILVALGVAVYTFWASRGSRDQEKNSKEIEKMRYKISAIERMLAADACIIDTVAGALHCLDSRQTALFYLSTMGDDTGCFEEEEVAQLGELQRKLTELGLFSEDKIRRISVQRALAHVDGDFKSLALMQKIEKGELGIRDPEIVDQIEVLKHRLEKLAEYSTVWPGRPGGGEF